MSFARWWPSDSWWGVVRGGGLFFQCLGSEQLLHKGESATSVSAEGIEREREERGVCSNEFCAVRVEQMTTTKNVE